MYEYLKALYRIWFVYRDYKPQPLSIAVFNKWLAQFPKEHRHTILRLFNSIDYLSERETKLILTDLNKELTNYLFTSSDLNYENVIYATFSSPGSSSHVILNLLRDAENLERRKANLVDIGNIQRFSEVTADVQDGVIIYIDDFAGTGNQFSNCYKFAAQFIQGNFSEYFLAPVICEEAYHTISELGVIPVYNRIHKILQRPLHSTSNILNNEEKESIVAICREINKRGGLGYKDMAAMVVFYRNAVNNLPQLFRGNLKQSPKIGIFPRSDDLSF